MALAGLVAIISLCDRYFRNVWQTDDSQWFSGDANKGDQTQLAMASVAQQPAATPVDCLALYAIVRRMRPKQTAPSIR